MGPKDGNGLVSRVASAFRGNRGLQAAGASGIIVIGVLAVVLGSSGSETPKNHSLSEDCGSLRGEAYTECANSYNGHPAASDQQESGSEAGTSSSSGSSSATSLPPVVTLHLHSDEGYTAEVVLRRGNLEPAKPGSRQGRLRLGSACQINYKTAAVEPYELSIINTTRRYEAKPGIDVIAKTPHAELPGLLAEIGYTNEPECIELSGDAYPGDENEGGGGQDYVALAPTNPLPAGQATFAPGFFILPKYYSPAHPQGNPLMFKNTILELDPSGSEGFGVTSASGVLKSTVSSSAVSLLPGGNGGCVANPPCPAAFKTE